MPEGPPPPRHVTKRTRAPNGFATVGLLLADMHTGASCSLWPGVAEEAAREGVNLICFPGGRLRAEGGPEAHRNAVYDLAGPDCLDGIVTWSSSLGGGLDPLSVDAFHRRYEGVPLVCIAQSVRNAPTIAVDAYRGMQEVIDHLLEVHRVSHIAFIRGPATHPSAEDRFRAYRDSLARHGIELLDALVTRPLRWDEGSEAVRTLLDDRGLRPGKDFHAVAAASDLLALWALKSLQERDVRVPGDVLVTGFNDTAESRLATPPLTTAAVPFRAQGARALAMLAAVMAGQPVPKEVTLASRLRVRRSCGCPSSAVSLAASDPQPPAIGCRDARELRAALRDARDECLTELTDLAGVGEDGRAAWLEPLFDSFVEDIGGPTSERFRAMLDSVLDRAILAEAETTSWQDAISALRRRVLRLLPSSSRPGAEDLFSQARVLISEATGRERTYRQWRADRLSESLRSVGAALLSAFDVGRLADTLADSLPALGIPCFYLALYEKPEEGLAQARMVLACTDKGRADLPRDGLPFPSRLLVPREFLPRSRRYDLVVEPLHFQDQRIGYGVFEIGPRDGAVYEQLRGSIASALKGALLLRDAREARAAAEKADLVKTRLLANVSHELRAPLGIITQQATAALDAAAKEGTPLPPALGESLSLIRGSAEHQLRVINDLLDLSRADIEELDLDLRLIDPRPLLVEVFQGFAAQGGARTGVTVEMAVPERLPMIRADPVRLRQILFNLMGNALKFTSRGRVTLAAEVAPPSLLVSVADEGPGVPACIKERIFEPFVSAEAGKGSGAGIGLGLTIARHLAALHGGDLTVESAPGRGSVFTLRLPLPGLTGEMVPARGKTEPVLLLVSRSGTASAAITDFCRARGLRVHLLRADDDLEGDLAGLTPAALAWDLADSAPDDWRLLRRLRHHPRLFQAPVVLYGQPAEAGAPGLGLTGILPKAAPGGALIDLIEASFPAGSSGPVLVVDDDPAERSTQEAMVRTGLPGCRVRAAADGGAALQAMEEETPSLVLLDLAMPVMDGMEVLERMRADPRLRRVPVIVLTNRVLDDAEVRRIEAHAQVTLQSKGIWSDTEAVAALHRSLFGTEGLPPHTGALVKRAIAWLARNHAREITRWQLAEAVSASADYVGRVFHRELGISPLDYLNRYRVHRARELLQGTGESVKAIAALVGFHDQAYFGRVFRKVTGRTPQQFRRAE